MGRRVLIIGGGVVGLSTAYYAVRRGHQVTVIDRGAANSSDSCSFGNAGMVVPSHMVPLAAPGMMALALRNTWKPQSPLHVRPRLGPDFLRFAFSFWRASTKKRVVLAAPILRDLHLASRRCYEEWAAEWGDEIGLFKRGLLVLCETEHELEHEVSAAKFAESLGIPAAVVRGNELARLEPDIRMNVAGGVHFPLDCHLQPDRLMFALRKRLADAGVTFRCDTEVTGFRAADKRVDTVQTNRGEIAVDDELVIAAGVWSKLLARDLRVRVPLEAGKGYSVMVERPRRLPSQGIILTEARVAVTPMGGALRFAGTMDLGSINMKVNRSRVKGMIKAITRALPDFTENDFRELPVWAGLRPCSPDGLPYLGRIERYANLSVASGHAMIGVSLGPITGKLMADIVSGDPPSIDISLLKADRYA